MGFFDWMAGPQGQNLNNALLSLGAGFGQASMPSRTPVPFSGALGMAAQNLQQGMQQNFQNDTTRLDNASKRLTIQDQIQNYNMLAPYLGYQPVTPEQLGIKGFSPGGIPPANAQPGAAQTPGGGATPSAPPATAQGSFFGPAAAIASTAAPASTDPAAQGGWAPAPNAAPAAPAVAPPNLFIKNALMKRFGINPTDYQNAKGYASMLPQGSPEREEAEQYAAKLAGKDITANVREGSVLLQYQPSTGGYHIAFKNPKVAEGTTIDENGNNIEVPNAMALIGKAAIAKARGAASFKPLTVNDQAGNEQIVPSTALQDGMPGQTPAGQTQGGGIPYAVAVNQLENPGNQAPQPGAPSSAAGPDQFVDKTWLEQVKRFLPENQRQGMSDQQLMGLRTTDPKLSAAVTTAYGVENGLAMQKAGIQRVGAPELYLAHHFGATGATNILKAPANTPIEDVVSPEVMQANPQLAGHTTGEVYASIAPAFRGVQSPFSAGMTPKAQQQGQAPQQMAANAQQPGAPMLAPQKPLRPGEPNTPVQNSSLAIPNKLDDFLGQLGPNYAPPQRAAAAPGALMGAPNEAVKEMQKDDAERVAQYSKEASGGQKVYTNLQQLYQILGRGFSTGNLTAEATHLTNYAQQIGLGSLVPKNFNPADAGAFNKLATDLVFSQLKQIGGRPMVSEIEGLKQANPNTAMPPAANLEVLTNILADQRWRDSRADLSRQYVTRFGSLGDFDARFNEKYPQVDAYNQIADAAVKGGWKLPGSDNGRVVSKDVQGQITPEALAYTAKQRNMSVADVKAALRARGYRVD